MTAELNSSVDTSSVGDTSSNILVTDSVSDLSSFSDSLISADTSINDTVESSVNDDSLFTDTLHTGFSAVTSVDSFSDQSNESIEGIYHNTSYLVVFMFVTVVALLGYFFGKFLWSLIDL